MMLKRLIVCTLLAQLILGVFRQAKAQVPLQIALVFSDHMVLQRNQPIAIYGSAAAGEQLSVSFAGQSRSVSANAAGKWNAVFPPQQAGGPWDIRVTGAGSEMRVQDVLIGDVWLCSGQSNMDFALKGAHGGQEEIGKGQFNPHIRLMKYGSTAPGGNLAWDSVMLEKVNRFEVYQGQWKMPDAASVASFSAVAYYFGKKIAAGTAVPIGLIQVALGGSPTESWIDSAVLARDGRFADMLRDWEHSAQVMEWCRQRADENTQHARSGAQRHTFMPGYNFRAGIEPFTAFPITGVIWYQGESNVHDVALHEALFETLVKSWRARWGREFPFYFVQLSSIQRASWPEFRDSQRRLAARIPATGMAVSHDLGDSLDVHPTCKKEIGERLASRALHDVYRLKVQPEGPVIRRVARVGNILELHFASAKKLQTLGHQPLTGFELVDAAGRRVTASAEIFRKRVRIHVPANMRPVAVLYAYQPFSRASLCNEADLPASTFSISIP